MRLVWFSTLLILIFTSCSLKKPSVEQHADPWLNLSFDEFDQTLGGGWRTLADDLHFLQAAERIDKYIETNAKSLTVDQIVILTWHAGQMYAFAGDTTTARQRFVKSIYAKQPLSSIRWNDYVHATIAFLDKDLERLKAYRKTISQGWKVKGKVPNLDVVDNLIKCFDQTYAVAYSCRLLSKLTPSVGGILRNKRHYPYLTLF
jgi:hypothetical protein